MISAFNIYLITRLDNIEFAFIVGAMLSFVVCAAFTFAIICRITEDDKELLERMAKPAKVALVVFILFLTGIVLTPNAKDAAAIYLIPKIANNEQIQDIGGNALDILQNKFQEWVDDMGDIKKD